MLSIIRLLCFFCGYKKYKVYKSKIPSKFSLGVRTNNHFIYVSEFIYKNAEILIKESRKIGFLYGVFDIPVQGLYQMCFLNLPDGRQAQI